MKITNITQSAYKNVDYLKTLKNGYNAFWKDKLFKYRTKQPHLIKLETRFPMEYPTQI